MIVYEVTLAVDADVAEAYAAWLEPHIAEVVAAGGFEGAAWFDVIDPPADGRVHWCVQYRVRDRATLDAYVSGAAERLRRDARVRFSGRFEASRRVLRVR